LRIGVQKIRVLNREDRLPKLPIFKSNEKAAPPGGSLKVSTDVAEA
jgi:hypothetical protein